MDADGGVVRSMARDQEDAGVVADVHRQRRGHGGKDDGIVEGNQTESFHFAERS